MKPSGYVISSDREEYLSDFSFAPGHIKRVWSPFIDSAKVFQSKAQADTILKKLQSPYRLWVLQLLETPTAFIVTTGSVIRPHWLHG